MTRITLLLLCLLSPLAQAADAATRLADILGAARSMQADFNQQVSGSNGSVLQQAQGSMTVSRPSLFRWDVRTPFEQLILADGKQVWVYDPDLAQAVVRPFDRQLADTPALLFSGDARQIGQRFAVTLLAEQGSKLKFELRPRSEDALFESMQVSFDNGRLVAMVLLDSLGQRTSVAFSNVVLNAAVPVSRFVFSPPAGTDVIREGD